jgi:hypothetical protein
MHKWGRTGISEHVNTPKFGFDVVAHERTGIGLEEAKSVGRQTKVDLRQKCGSDM